MSEPQYVTLPDAAERLGVSVRTARKRLKAERWETHLEGVQGAGFRTQRRMVALQDVLAMKQTIERPEHPEAPFPAVRPEAFTALAQVGNQAEALGKRLDRNTAAVERLARILESNAQRDPWWSYAGEAAALALAVLAVGALIALSALLL